MHALSRKIVLISLSALLLASVGCRKKPRRDPSQTVIGQTGVPGTITPFGTGDMGGIYTDGSAPGTDLSTRGSGDINDPANQERGVLQSVFFAYDSANISAAEQPKLSAAKAHLDANPGKRLLIEGRCDWRGTTEYNLGLGDRRAQAAKQYLVTLGVPETSIEVLSKGDLEAAEGASDSVMAQDRRAELVVLKQ
jgi:peptidoglycan-associated lipoprotein